MVLEMMSLNSRDLPPSKPGIQSNAAVCFTHLEVLY